MKSFEKLKLVAQLESAAAQLKKNAPTDNLEEEIFAYIMEHCLDELKSVRWELKSLWGSGGWSTPPTALDKGEAILAAVEAMRKLQRRSCGIVISPRHGMSIRLSRSNHEHLHWSLSFASLEDVYEAIRFYGLRVNWSEVETYLQKIHNDASDAYAKAERYYVDTAEELKNLRAFICDPKSTE